jgi:hypothetical protein
MFYEKYHLNIKHNYHVHKYDTRGSHDLHISDCTTSLYEKCILNMGIKKYKLPEKIKRFYTVNNFKKELKSILFKNAFYTVEVYLQAAL